MSTIASQITSLTIVYSTVYSDADQRKHQSSASLAFVLGIHRGPVTQKMFPFDDVIMLFCFLTHAEMPRSGFRDRSPYLKIFGQIGIDNGVVELHWTEFLYIWSRFHNHADFKWALTTFTELRIIQMTEFQRDQFVCYTQTYQAAWILHTAIKQILSSMPNLNTNFPQGESVAKPEKLPLIILSLVCK